MGQRGTPTPPHSLTCTRLAPPPADSEPAIEVVDQVLHLISPIDVRFNIAGVSRSLDDLAIAEVSAIARISYLSFLNLHRRNFQGCEHGCQHAQGEHPGRTIAGDDKPQQRKRGEF